MVAKARGMRLDELQEELKEWTRAKRRRKGRETAKRSLAPEEKSRRRTKLRK